MTLALQLLTWQLPWAGVPTYTVTHIVINGGRPEIPPWQQLPGPDTAKFAGLHSYVRLMRWVLQPARDGLAMSAGSQLLALAAVGTPSCTDAAMPECRLALFGLAADATRHLPRAWTLLQGVLVAGPQGAAHIC